MNEDILEKYYQEGLEERLISYISDKKGISREHAMDIYYHSKMADRIHERVYGVQYLDHKVLAQMLIDSEPELFSR